MHYTLHFNADGGYPYLLENRSSKAFEVDCPSPLRNYDTTSRQGGEGLKSETAG